ncbi:MAG: hypothetical protein KA715_05765 [Xanthomonadaceae bacterium]|nr:hypothetical protein [Xanthomonadaceae bacterium]
MIALIVVFHAMTSYAGEKKEERHPSSVKSIETEVQVTRTVDSFREIRVIDRIVDKEGNICFAVSSSHGSGISCVSKK